MKIGKICKVYVGIGMAMAAYGLSEYKKHDPEMYAALPFKKKVRIFVDLIVTWPDPVITGFARAVKKHVKDNKESANESES